MVTDVCDEKRVRMKAVGANVSMSPCSVICLHVCQCCNLMDSLSFLNGCVVLKWRNPLIPGLSMWYIRAFNILTYMENLNVIT